MAPDIIAANTASSATTVQSISSSGEVIGIVHIVDLRSMCQLASRTTTVLLHPQLHDIRSHISSTRQLDHQYSLLNLGALRNSSFRSRIQRTRQEHITRSLRQSKVLDIPTSLNKEVVRHMPVAAVDAAYFCRRKVVVVMSDVGRLLTLE